MGFLLSRRWLGFLVVVVALAFAATRLGEWQFDRLHERRAQNAQIRTNVAEAPVPADQVLRTHREPAATQEWRRVTVDGRWDDRHTVVIRYQTRGGGPGVDVVTPLVTDDGRAVVVDRGWMSAPNSGSRRPDVPAATSGPVSITGYVRVDATGGSAKVSDLSARSVSAREVGRVVPYDVYRGFVMMTEQAPTPDRALGGPELPELDDGPHFFYGLQWWFFGLLALVGFGYLAWDERRRRREERAAAAAVDPQEERAQAGSGAVSSTS